MASKDAKELPPPFFIYELPSRGIKLVFQNRDAVTEWATKENNAWSTTIASGPPSFPQLFRQSFDRARNLISNVFNTAKSITDEPQSKAPFFGALDQLFNDGQFPHPLVSTRSFLQHVKETRGERTMQAALASLIAPPRGSLWNLEIGDAELREGFILGTLHRSGVDPFKMFSANSTLKLLTQEFEGSIADAKNNLNNFKKTFASVMNNTAENAKREATSQRFHFDHQTADFENESRDAVAAIKATEATFREHMHLRAPVDYWKSKAKEHRKSARRFGRILVGYSIIGGVGLLFGLWELTRLTLPSTSADPTQYFRTAGIGLIASTIIIWIGRVLLRLFLSERHLATDADERVTLVMTYLALTQDGKLDPADRPIVLAPLFRAASDGIVKDDGAPETSLATMLARMPSGTR